MLSVSLLLDSSTIVIESQAGHLHQVILSAAAAGSGFPPNLTSDGPKF